MKQEVIDKLKIKLMKCFDGSQIDFVINQLNIVLYDYDIIKQERALTAEIGNPDENLINKFLATKLINGCSKKTIEYYKNVIAYVRRNINKPLDKLTTDDIRYLIAVFDMKGTMNKSSQDNVLRVLKSFYNWMVQEDLITKSPENKIAKIKERKKVKEAFTDGELAKLRYQCTLFTKEIERLRNTAIIETLLSTGCRVSELSNIRIEDMDDDKIIVLGKGNKERTVYLNGASKFAIQNYLNKRTDKCPYLFVTIFAPYKQLKISGIEIFLRKLGKEAGVDKVHPHKFRRTAATNAMRKGMPIELVSRMLGHTNITTTQIYLQIDEDDLKVNHKKYM